MNEIEINRSLFFTINDYKEIGTPKISMWSLSDKHAYAPFFRFKFKKGDDTAYKKIKNIVSSFQGNFSWIMKKNEEKFPAYIIAPENYIEKILFNKGHFRSDFLKEMPEQAYEKMINEVIEDISSLSSYLTAKLKE